MSASGDPRAATAMRAPGDTLDGKAGAEGVAAVQPAANAAAPTVDAAQPPKTRTEGAQSDRTSENGEGRAKDAKSASTANSANNASGAPNATSAPETPTKERSGSAGEPCVVEWGGPNNRYGRMNVVLGKGAYKVVWRAIDKEEGVEVAWNVCPTTRSEYNQLGDEVEILKKMRHPNIIAFHDSWYADGAVVFITEMMSSGTLREFGRVLHPVPLKVVRRWTRQIARGLAYLHGQSPPVVHRDIKCDNVFVNGASGEVKIGDMGTAKMRHGRKYTVVGTPEFMAPEMYDERGYSEKADVYALGMCVLEMATGEYPYAECRNAAQIYKKVTSGGRPDCLARVTDRDVLSLVHACIAPEAERSSAKRLLEHPFLLEEPEVVVLWTNAERTRLKLQVLFKGHERHSVKFEYDCESDTPADVVREMVDERVMPAKYRGPVVAEIHRVLRDLARAPAARAADSAAGPSGGGDASAASALPRHVVLHSRANSEVEAGTAWPDETSIDEVAAAVARTSGRSAERAAAWASRLRAEDFETAGDLRRMHDADWARTGLSVFAARALRDAIKPVRRADTVRD